MKYRHVLKREEGKIDTGEGFRPYKVYHLEQIATDEKRRYKGSKPNLLALAQDCLEKGSHEIEIAPLTTIPAPEVIKPHELEFHPCSIEELREFKFKYCQLKNKKN